MAANKQPDERGIGYHSRMGMNEEEFNDFIGYVAMVNSDEPEVGEKKGCGLLWLVVILALLVLCILSSTRG